MRKLLLLTAVVAVLSCSAKRTAENSSSTAFLSDTTEGIVIEEKLKTYYNDMSNRDWKKYKDHFWKNGTITTAWQQPGDSAASVDVTVIDDFIKETPNGPDSQPIFEERMKNSRIKVEGNIAEAWVGYEAKFGTTDSLMQWTGTDVFTLLKNNGEWKIVSLVFESGR